MKVDWSKVSDFHDAACRFRSEKKVRARARGFILLSVEILIHSARKSGKNSEKRVNPRHTHYLLSFASWRGVSPRPSPIIQHHWVRAWKEAFRPQIRECVRYTPFLFYLGVGRRNIIIIPAAAKRFVMVLVCKFHFCSAAKDAVPGGRCELI